MSSTQMTTSGTAMDAHDDHAAEAVRLGCAALVDAMGRLHGHRAHLLPLVSPDPTRSLFGPAVTIAYLPYRDDLAPESDFGALFHQAIDADTRRREVLVLSNGGYPDVSHAGGTKLSRVDLHGLAGVLTDARLRDFNELRAYGFATWCRGEAVHWGGDTAMPYAANVAVEIGGVGIMPGDYVFVDRSGGVVIPAASLREVFDIAHQIANDDEGALREIRRMRP
jgi:regulator of RNase E activity RraA